MRSEGTELPRRWTDDLPTSKVAKCAICRVPATDPPIETFTLRVRITFGSTLCNGRDAMRYVPVSAVPNAMVGLPSRVGCTAIVYPTNAGGGRIPALRACRVRAGTR